MAKAYLIIRVEELFKPLNKLEIILESALDETLNRYHLFENVINGRFLNKLTKREVI